MLKNKKNTVYDLKNIDIDTMISLIDGDELRDLSKVKNLSVLSYDEIFKLLENEKVMKMIIKDSNLISELIEQNDKVEIVILDHDYCDKFIDVFDNDMDVLNFVFNYLSDSKKIFNSFMNNDKFLNIIVKNVSNIKNDEMKIKFVLNFPATKGHLIQGTLASYVIEHPNIINLMKVSDIYAIIKLSIIKDYNKDVILNLMNENAKAYANYIKIRINFDRNKKIKHEIKDFNFKNNGCLSMIKNDSI